MRWEEAKKEFDNFAEIYDLISRAEQAVDPVSSGCRRLIERVRPRTILDCACGTGKAAISLRKAGFSVLGSDISTSMIRLARQNALAAGVRIPFIVSPWHQLPRHSRRKFDLVMCHGNAIGNCPSPGATLESLRAMRAMTNVGGFLYLDSRSWEWFRTRSVRFWPAQSKVVENGTHTILYVATVPRRWSDPHVIEIVHILERDGKLTVRGYPVSFCAFRFGELVRCVRKAGFDQIESDYRPDCARYWVTARAL